MGSLTDSLGKPIEVEIRGKKYKFSPITIDDIAEFEGYLRTEAIKSFRKSVDGDMELKKCPVCGGVGYISREGKEAKVICPSCRGNGYVNVYLDTIMNLSKKSFSFDELTESMFTISGATFLVWRSVVKNHSEIKLKDMGSIIGMDNMEEIFNILDLITRGAETEKNLEGVKREEK